MLTVSAKKAFDLRFNYSSFEGIWFEKKIVK